MPRFFTVKEVAQILRRHPNIIYRWLDECFLRGRLVFHHADGTKQANSAGGFIMPYRLRKQERQSVKE